MSTITFIKIAQKEIIQVSFCAMEMRLMNRGSLC